MSSILFLIGYRDFTSTFIITTIGVMGGMIIHERQLSTTALIGIYEGLAKLSCLVLEALDDHVPVGHEGWLGEDLRLRNVVQGDPDRSIHLFEHLLHVRVVLDQLEVGVWSVDVVLAQVLE